MWTRAQWEAIRWRFVLPTYEEIANRLGIAYQNVQKRLKAANWGEFSRGLEFVGNALKTHLRKGAKDHFTEYYLIGTLTSISIAFFGGLLLRYLLV